MSMSMYLFMSLSFLYENSLKVFYLSREAFKSFQAPRDIKIIESQIVL